MLAVDTYKVSFEVYSPVSGKVVYLNQEMDGEGVKVIDENPYAYLLFALEMEKISTLGRKFMDARTYLKALEEREVNICGHREGIGCREED